MKDFVPVLVAMVWPVAIVLVMLVQRRWIARTCEALVSRVERGAPLKAGGVELGPAPSLPVVERDKDPRHIDSLPHDVYLVHEAWRDQGLDREGKDFFRLRIFMDSDTPERLMDVRTVTYRLHPTFRNPVRKMTDETTRFELVTAAWGEFNMTAEVEFAGGDTLVIERYINLPMRSVA